MDLDSLFLLIFILSWPLAFGLAIYNSVQLGLHGRFSYRHSMQALMYMGVVSMLLKAQLTINSLTFATHPWIILAFFVALFIQAINVFWSFRKDRGSNACFHSALRMLEVAYPELPRKEHQERANKIADDFENGRHDIVDDFMRDITNRRS